MRLQLFVVTDLFGWLALSLLLQHLLRRPSRHFEKILYAVHRLVEPAAQVRLILDLQEWVFAKVNSRPTLSRQNMAKVVFTIARSEIQRLGMLHTHITRTVNPLIGEERKTQRKPAFDEVPARQMNDANVVIADQVLPNFASLRVGARLMEEHRKANGNWIARGLIKH